MPSPLPTRRAVFTNVPDALLKAIDEVGSSTPAPAAWSLHVAVRLPNALMLASVCGAPGALSLTWNAAPNVLVFGTSATNLPGRRPLSVPERFVATSLPAADESDAPLYTALLPSTDPAREA